MIIDNLNTKAVTILQQEIGDQYSATRHMFKLSMLQRDVELQVGSYLKVPFDDNLKCILGFKSSSFNQESYESDQMPATLQDREQLLFVERTCSTRRGVVWTIFDV